MEPFSQNKTGFYLAVLFWVGYLAIVPYYLGREAHDYLLGFLMALNASFFHIGTILYNTHYLIPRYLSRRRYLYYLGLLLATMLLAVVARAQIESLIQFFFNRPSIDTGNLLVYLKLLLGEVFFVGLFMLGKFTADWFANESLRQELEHQRLSAELSFLKAQINPHFFFNTLNNLYTLAYKNSPETPDVILKLSELMRYMLYESKEQRVPLEREIEHLNHFTDLQLLRQQDGTDFSFELSGTADDWMIEPMLLLPFVENAFKHARRNEEGFFIRINVHAEAHKLIFVVANTHLLSTLATRDPTPPPSNLGLLQALLKERKRRTDASADGGIGLENVSRRLALLYPNAHRLQIDTLPDEYRITLILTRK